MTAKLDLEAELADNRDMMKSLVEKNIELDQELKAMKRKVYTAKQLFANEKQESTVMSHL